MKKFKFTIRGNDYDVDIINFEDNIAKIEVNGTRYDVEVHKTKQETKTPIMMRKPVFVPKGSHEIKKGANGKTEIEAPLPGSIMKIFVKEGDVVTKDTKLFIMEAMKMENNIFAERDGVVKEIKIAVGDSVLQGDVLMVIE